MDGVALAAILSFLRRKDYIPKDRAPPPQEMLDALVQACRPDSGRAVCLRSSVTFQAAALLGISVQEAAAFGPYQVHHVLCETGHVSWCYVSLYI